MPVRRANPVANLFLQRKCVVVAALAAIEFNLAEAATDHLFRFTTMKI